MRVVYIGRNSTNVRNWVAPVSIRDAMFIQ